MAEEPNGHGDASRIDRIERAIEGLIDGHERLLASQQQLPPAQARAVAGHCRLMWDNRDQIYRRLGKQPDAGLSSQVRADLLDLAILHAHFRVCLAGASADVAGRMGSLAAAYVVEQHGPQRHRFDVPGFRDRYAVAFGASLDLPSKTAA